MLSVNVGSDKAAGGFIWLITHTRTHVEMNTSIVHQSIERLPRTVIITEILCFNKKGQLGLVINLLLHYRFLLLLLLLLQSLATIANIENREMVMVCAIVIYNQVCGLCTQEWKRMRQES